MGAGDWIGVLSFISAIIAIAFAYLRRPSFVPAARLLDLRDELKECRDSREDALRQVKRLMQRLERRDAQYERAMADAEWYRRRLEEREGRVASAVPRPPMRPMDDDSDGSDER